MNFTDKIDSATTKMSTDSTTALVNELTDSLSSPSPLPSNVDDLIYTTVNISTSGQCLNSTISPTQLFNLQVFYLNWIFWLLFTVITGLNESKV